MPSVSSKSTWKCPGSATSSPQLKSVAKKSSLTKWLALLQSSAAARKARHAIRWSEEEAEGLAEMGGFEASLAAPLPVESLDLRLHQLQLPAAWSAHVGMMEVLDCGA